jgi:hypothetical protein
MLKVGTAKFLEWMKFQLMFPYSHMMVIRSSFYCKWVMYRGDINGEGVRGMATERFPVLASTLGPERLQEVIMSGEAKPLTKEMADIMDDMYVWGQSRNYHWYCNVVDLMHNWLVCNMDVPKKEMVRACIAMEVKSLIYTYFAVNSIVGHTIYMIGTMLGLRLGTHMQLMTSRLLHSPVWTMLVRKLPTTSTWPSSKQWLILYVIQRVQ